MTRTIHIGHVTDQEREIYDVVLRANKALIEQAKEGVTYREFDAIPREIINAAGYGANFTHGIGHGLVWIFMNIRILENLTRLSRQVWS